MVHLNWSHFKPEFSGKPDEDAETHLLHTNNWMNAHHFVEDVKVLYNILLPINHYIGNNTTKCHSRSMSDNRDLTETFHQKISSHYKVIASAF